MEPPLEPPEQNQVPERVEERSKKSGISKVYGDRIYPFLLTGLVISSFGLLLGTFIRLISTVRNQPVVNQPLPNSSQIPNSEVPNPTVGNNPSLNNPSSDLISLTKYEQIQNGMTIPQVQKLIGSEGKLLGSSNISGTTGKVYWWQNPQGSNAIVEFKNDLVVSKSQAGLN